MGEEMMTRALFFPVDTNVFIDKGKEILQSQKELITRSIFILIFI